MDWPERSCLALKRQVPAFNSLLIIESLGWSGLRWSEIRTGAASEMSTTTSLMTADELFALPDDGFRYDLVKGELHRMSPAGSRHGAIIARLTGAIVPHVEAKGLGEVFGAETGFKLASDPDTVRAPDIAFVRAERIPAGDIPEAFWPGAPDLAVEVVSPSDTVYEVEGKIEDYLTAGVRLIWLVNPKKGTVTVLGPGTAQTLTVDDQLTGGDVLPGFRYHLAQLFRSQTPSTMAR